MILASASPRRQSLLALLGIDFEIVVPDVEELSEGEPAELVVENALRKARGGRALTTPDEVVLGVDTDVALDGALLGKPEDPAAARAGLERLAGRTHDVFSGVALIAAGVERTELVRSRVTFRTLTPAEIITYVAAEEWRGCAGGYAVQGLGSSLVERIDGDLSNVIGLPIPALAKMINGLQDP